MPEGSGAAAEAQSRAPHSARGAGRAPLREHRVLIPCVRAVRRRELRPVALQHRVRVLHELADACSAACRRRRCLRPAASAVEEMCRDAGEMLWVSSVVGRGFFVFVGVLAFMDGVVVIGVRQLRLGLQHMHVHDAKVLPAWRIVCTESIILITPSKTICLLLNTERSGYLGARP